MINFTLLFTNLDLHLIRYDLEETTIETTLITKYNEGKFTNTPDIEKIDAAKYILNKSESALKQYNSMKDSIDEINTLNKKHQLQINTKTLTDLITSRKNTIAEMVNLANKTILQTSQVLIAQGHDVNAVVSFIDEPHHKSCAHDKPLPQLPGLLQ